MGLLKADQLRNGAGTGNADLFKQWAAKAWANLNGTGTIALRDSRNIASVVDNGTGDYTFNYISNMTNTSYNATLGSDLSNLFFQSGSLSASFMRLSGSYAAGTIADGAQIHFDTHGDLA